MSVLQALEPPGFRHGFCFCSPMGEGRKDQWGASALRSERVGGGAEEPVLNFAGAGPVTGGSRAPHPSRHVRTRGGGRGGSPSPQTQLWGRTGRARKAEITVNNISVKCIKSQNKCKLSMISKTISVLGKDRISRTDFSLHFGLQCGWHSADFSLLFFF